MAKVLAEPPRVIKVRYGETLRRFRSQIVDGKLDLDMNALREKVHSLFSFPVGSELRLTYIDDDKDVVTLADDEDLNEIVRQWLNPLRITVVKLKTKRSASSQSKASGNHLKKINNIKWKFNSLNKVLNLAKKKTRCL